MRRWSWVVGLLALFAAAPVFAETPRSVFNDWTAVVVAGDWRAHEGGGTEAFDNARRDVAATLETLGFRPENVAQFSSRPDRYPDTRPRAITQPAMLEALRAGASRAKAGCLVYYTSHGEPRGAVLDVNGDMLLLRPGDLAGMLNDACPGRPAIVIISACFSGVFVPALRNENRLILTAARPDRTSFGCGESDRYPFFDDCFLSSIEGARDFAVLPPRVQACVAAKEKTMGMAPPSEPQVWSGGLLRPMLPLMSFPPGAKAVRRE